jgi:nucleoside-diphosphate-sugar epimerase
MTRPSTLIVGCGYVGLPLARQLMEQGHQVTGWVHSASSADALAGQGFHRVIVGSVGHPPLWETVGEDFDFAIHCASSGHGGTEAYEEVFLQGGSLLNQHLARARRLFVSSTSVYGETAGEIVTEETPAQPATITGKILALAESSALASGAVVARSSGIYGPGRGVLFEKFRRGEAVIEGDGLRWLNQIHQRDVVAALAHLLHQGEPGNLYNLTDDTPVTLLDFYTWCAGFLHQPLPPYGPVNPRRKRGLTSKRVANAKLRATGWRPLYPSFREGLTADHCARDLEA